jgi:fructokinase
MAKRIGIDLGGTKIEGVLLDEAGEIVERKRVPTPRDDYEATVLAVRDLIRHLEAPEAETPLVGVGMPGSVSTLTGAMKNCNSTVLNGRYFRRDLVAALGRDVAIANDADCFALSEAVDGAGADANRIFGAILGTGVGGGIVQGKRLLTGPNGLCGEWGHNLLPREGRALDAPSRMCFCGHADCIETYLSGPGLARTHAVLAGESLSAPAIAERAAAGDAAAARTLDVYAAQLAFALSQIVNVLDPDAVVLGGGVSNIGLLYEAVPARWGEWVTSDVVETRLLRARFGDSSGVRGAAWLPGGPPEAGHGDAPRR